MVKTKRHILSGITYGTNIIGDVESLIFLLSAFLQNFFLRQDRLSGDVPHLSQPC